jgi:histidinol-phosphate aminotransferase
VLAALAAAAPGVHRYGEQEALRVRLAGDVGVAPDQVALTNGSDELCFLLAALLVEPGAPVVLSDPCYRVDEIATRVQQGQVRLVPLRDGSHDLDAMAAAAVGAALAWLPSPHNPTGCAVSPDRLARFLADVPEDCVVVLDEAYRAFTDPGTRPDVRGLLARHPNLVVQRSFSKEHALAGLRVGYGLGHPEVVGALHALRPPFNVNVAGLAAAEAAVDDRAWRDYAVTLVRRERARFEAFLGELAIPFWPSQANFVTLQLGDDAPRAHEALEARGLAARDGGDLGLPGWMRITIGTAPQMALVREALREVVG